MSLRNRFLLLTAIFALLSGGFFLLLEVQIDELREIRHHIEDDWSETRLLVELEQGFAAIHKDIEEKGASADVSKLVAQLGELEAVAATIRSHAEDGLTGGAGELGEFEALEEIDKSLAEWRAFLDEDAWGRTAHSELLTAMNEIYGRSASAAGSYKEAALQELGESLERLDRSESLIERIALNATAGTVLLVLLAWFLFGFWLLRPIRRLRSMVRRVRQRRYDRVRRFKAPGEIGEVIDSFQEMVDEIRAFTGELETRVVARTAELEASRERLRLMLDRLPDALGLREATGELLMANPAYHTLFPEADTQTVAGIAASDETAQGYHRWKDPEGRIRLLDVKRFSLGQGERGQSVTLEHVRDMTRQVEVDNALATAQRLASLGRLSSGVAHEINNPLTAIAACSEGLLKRLGQGDAEHETFNEYLTMIHQEVYRCKEITERLLDLSRRRDAEIEDCDLTDIARDVFRLVDRHAASHDVRLVTDFDESLHLRTSHGAVRQVLLNLVFNAIEASHGGGVVRVSIYLEEQSAVIRVKDDGVGVSPDDLPHIFEPFFTRRRDKSGTGLGLYVCQGLAEALGGSISARSDGPGTGSEFSLRLPLQAPLQPDSTKQQHAHA